MLLTHGPFVSLSYTVILFAPFTWASLSRRQPVPISPGAAYPPPPEGSPTLAPGWSPSPPVWSLPTPASSTTAPGGLYAQAPQPTTPYQPGAGGAAASTLLAPTSTCTPYQCNVFYQVSNIHPNRCTCVFIASSGLLYYIGLKPLRTLPACLRQRESLFQHSQPG